MSNGLVSIVMTTYNGEKFIKEQLESIINQTYKNLEIIICDDGSTDKTVYLIKEYQKKDNRIKLYQNEKNLGFYKNFEKAISLCNGDYIALSDQDDIWSPNKIEIMVREFQKDENIVLVYGDEYLIDENNKIIANSFFDITEYLVNNNNYKIFYTNCHIYGHNMMFKNNLKKYIIPIPIKFYDTWIALVASKKGKIKFINKKLGYYRQHNNSVSQVIRKKRSFMEKVLYPIDWKTYKIWNQDRIERIKVFKELFPEDKEYLDELINYYSHKNRMRAFVFALKNINYIINQKGVLRKLKYILLPLFAPKVDI
jgi:glycosyltransferase involved in cell wall biosynthesis